MSGERDAEMRAHFQERRRAWLIWQAAGMGLVLGGVGLGAIFENLSLWISLGIAGIGAAGLYFASSATNFRCPRCDNLVGRGDGPLNPESCEECGFLFR